MEIKLYNLIAESHYVLLILLNLVVQSFFFSILKGVKAAIMPTELTVGLGGKGYLSGRLSEDLDNTDTPWVVSVLFFRVSY